MTLTMLLAGAVRAEWLKFRSAPIVQVTTLLLVAGVPAIAAAALAAATGDGPGAKKAAAFVGDGGLDGLLTTAGQVSAAAGLLAFGAVFGWCFGREFTDGTIVGMFAQRTPRTLVAAAKLIVLAIWASACSLLLTGVAVGAGVLLDLPSTSTTAPLAIRLLLITVLTALLATCCTLVAGLTRSVLAPIAAAIALIVIAQFAALAGSGGWVPFAVPGLWAASATVGVDLTTGLQLAAVVAVALVAAGGTLLTWHRLRL